MRYGTFSADGQEYIIERPDTPASWNNYLGTDEYCAIVSNNAAGYAFHRSPKTGRMLRFRFNSVPMDRPGRYFYLRDADDGDYWSATWQPVAKPIAEPGCPPQAGQAEYRCIHRPGSSRFTSSYRSIETSLLAFVPSGENAEVWQLTVKNAGTAPRTLDVFGYVEWCFWHIMQDAMNFQYILYTCRMGEVDGIVDYALRLWPFEEPKGFFACTGRVESFETDRDAFLGPYRHEGTPQAVERGRLANGLAVGGTPCGALHTVMTLQPGESQTITFIAGVGDAREKGRELRKRFSDPLAVEAALVEVNRYYQTRLGKFTIQTPDADVNAMGGTWNQLQCHTTFNWSRSASFNEAGGRDGLGFRDSCQDVLAVVHAIPKEVEAKLTDLLRAQHSYGAAMHHVQPLTFTQGPHNITLPHYSDDHLWLLIAIPAYLRETGNAAFLDEVIDYADQGAGTVLQHLQKALDFSYAQRGPHGLCLGLAADWNDCLNLRGKGESTFTTFLFLRALREYLQLRERFPDSPQAGQSDDAHYRKMLAEMERAAAEHTWDGEWFLRGYVDSGKKLGSAESSGSTIFLNAQSWAVLSEAAPRERLVAAMDAMHERLATEHGAVLNAPAYVDHDAEVGAITTFPGGLKENGGIFCHANTWPVIAEAMLGRGDLAYKLYRSFLPAAKNDTADVYSMEPYVYAQFITGIDHQTHFGRGRNSWLTGTATWAFVALSQYILGIRADYDGLVLKPVIPTSWPGFTASREFRGAHYDIKVRGAGHIVSATIDGQATAPSTDGCLLVPVVRAGTRCQIEIECWTPPQPGAA
jgi:N,N'-diacetylchitobiose phosphorylase